MGRLDEMFVKTPFFSDFRSPVYKQFLYKKTSSSIIPTSHAHDSWYMLPQQIHTSESTITDNDSEVEEVCCESFLLGSGLGLRATTCSANKGLQV